MPSALNGSVTIAAGKTLILGTKANPEPSGSIGMMYYNTTSGTFRCYQGSGWTDYIASGSSGADTALSNLSSVAINTALLPGTDDSIDLGDTTHRWANIWLGGETMHIGASATNEATVAYTSSTHILNFATDTTSNGDISFFSNNLYLDKSTGFVGHRQHQPVDDVLGRLDEPVPSELLRCHGHHRLYPSLRQLRQSGSGTFATGTGMVSLNGDTTIAADMDFTMTSGTGTFTTGTGRLAERRHDDRGGHGFHHDLRHRNLHHRHRRGQPER